MAETTAELIAQGEDVTKTLTAPERDRLTECESIIKEGLGTFLAVGRALADIHDERLYRETHDSFKQYCRDVWALGKTTAEQKINSYKVVNLLEEKMPAIAGTFVNEFQTRPLTRLKEDDLLKACELVQEQLDQAPESKLTGALVKKAVKEVKGEVKKKKGAAAKAKIDGETELLSKLFRRQCSILADIINDERNSGWKTTSRKEAVKRLKVLVALAEDDD